MFCQLRYEALFCWSSLILCHVLELMWVGCYGELFLLICYVAVVSINTGDTTLIKFPEYNTDYAFCFLCKPSFALCFLQTTTLLN